MPDTHTSGSGKALSSGQAASVPGTVNRFKLTPGPGRPARKPRSLESRVKDLRAESAYLAEHLAEELRCHIGIVSRARKALSKRGTDRNKASELMVDAKKSLAQLRELSVGFGIMFDKASRGVESEVSVIRLPRQVLESIKTGLVPGNSLLTVAPVKSTQVVDNPSVTPSAN